MNGSVTINGTRYPVTIADLTPADVLPVFRTDTSILKTDSILLHSSGAEQNSAKKVLLPHLISILAMSVSEDVVLTIEPYYDENNEYKGMFWHYNSGWLRRTDNGEMIRVDDTAAEIALAADQAVRATEAANAAADGAVKADNRATSNENGRVAAENARKSDETERQNQESARQQNEQTRQEQENIREQRSATDHSTATDDHSKATSDHNRAEQDHSTAATDHSTALADHSTAGADHNRAEQDHSTALSDHSTADADHTRAEQDHSDALEATAGAEKVNATLVGMTVTITDRNGQSRSQNIGFEITEDHVYPSVAAMQADAANVLPGKFCMIATTDRTSEENARLYAKNSAGGFTFLSDLDQAATHAFADWMENYKPVIEGDHTRAEQDHATAAEDHTQAVSDSTRAGEDHARAEEDHTIATTDHTTAGNDHTRAEEDHTTATTDHTTAGNDHTRAEEDHTVAATDHTTAGNDHTRAEEDHTIATTDHTTAGNDHTRAETDHSTAADDHAQATTDSTRAGQDHTRAETDHSTAADDHTQATTDSTRAGQDHTRAESDHTTAVNNNEIAVSDHSQAARDHLVSVEQSAYAKAQGDHAKAQGDRCEVLNDHPQEIRSDGYVWAWDEETEAMVNTMRRIVATLDISSLTPEQREDLINQFVLNLASTTEGESVARGGAVGQDDEKKVITLAVLKACRDVFYGYITDISDKIPSQATPQNQLADKAFVNSSIATATATFRGTYNLVSTLSLTTAATGPQVAAALTGAVATADRNDYAYVQVPTADDRPSEIARVDRYKHDGTAWALEYTLNNSGFTASEWEAIQSGINSGLVAKLLALPDSIRLAEMLDAKQDNLTFEPKRTAAAMWDTHIIR